MESPEIIEDEEIADEEISDEKQICDNNAILNSIDNIDIHCTLNNNNNNSHPNHPTFFTSFNELSMNNNDDEDERNSSNMKNKNTTASLSSDHQKEECNFHSVLSYLCHATPCFSLRPSGLDKALRIRSLSFPSVFIDEEMQRNFNDIVFGQDSVHEDNDDAHTDIDVREPNTDNSAVNELVSTSYNAPDSIGEWKTIPIQRDDKSAEQIEALNASTEPADATHTPKSLDYFNDNDFRTKMKEVLLTHHSGLIDQKSIETLKSVEGSMDENFLQDDSKTRMTGHIIASQQQQTSDIVDVDDKISNNQSQQREILSFGDDNFVELTQDFHTPLRFTYQNDYFKDENFVRQMKNLWKHYHHGIDDSSINTSPSRQSLSTSRTTNTLSPTHSLSSLASAFSHTYSGASITSGGGFDGSMRYPHDFGPHFIKRHHIRSKHFLNDKSRKAPKRGHTISNIIYDCSAFESLPQADNEEDNEILADKDLEGVKCHETENDEKVELRNDTKINDSIEEAPTPNLKTETDQKDDPAAEFRKKKKKSKNRIRTATSGAFDYLKKKKQSKSNEEDQKTEPNMMLGEEAHCNLTDEDGGNSKKRK